MTVVTQKTGIFHGRLIEVEQSHCPEMPRINDRFDDAETQQSATMECRKHLYKTDSANLIHGSMCWFLSVESLKRLERVQKSWDGGILRYLGWWDQTI